MCSIDNNLYYTEEKLKYVLKKLQIHKGDLAKKLEVSQTLISQISDHSYGKLKKWHIYAICHAYQIPIEIFEDEAIQTTVQIDKILKHLKQTETIFTKDNELMNKLVGLWYFYSYSSHSPEEIWQTETTIYEDFTTKDKNKNRGKLFMGKNQSVIIKESHNAKNLNIITFDNNRITYNLFPFSRISKSNGLNSELFNFGFCSKNKLEYEDAKEILGDYQNVQLKIEHKMLERIYNFSTIRS